MGVGWAGVRRVKAKQISHGRSEWTCGYGREVAWLLSARYDVRLIKAGLCLPKEFEFLLWGEMLFNS